MSHQIFFWRDIYGDIDKFSPYLETIQRFAQGERSGLHFEKLRCPADPPIFSIRINDRTRLLFTIYQHSLCLLDVVLNHDYSNSLFLRHPKKVQKFLQVMLSSAPIIWDDEPIELPIYSGSSRYQPLDYYQEQFIYLSGAQEEVLSTKIPAIVMGPAGSGKTSTAFILLQAKVKEGIESSRIPSFFILKK